MPTRGTQCDNCVHGPMERCTQDCHVKEMMKHFQKFAESLPVYQINFGREED